MKKVAIVFVVAVFVPSMVLAWLAVRSLRDQQFLLERQASLLYQDLSDSVAAQIDSALTDYQKDFASNVAAVLGPRNPSELAPSFDELIRHNWPLAQVGFAVTTAGEILSPSPYGRAEARTFCADNGRFLANRESAEVYWNPKQNFNAPVNAQVQVASPAQSSSEMAQGSNALPQPAPALAQQRIQQGTAPVSNQSAQVITADSNEISQANSVALNNANNWNGQRGFLSNSKLETRNVVPKYQSRFGQNASGYENNFGRSGTPLPGNTMNQQAPVPGQTIQLTNPQPPSQGKEAQAAQQQIAANFVGSQTSAPWAGTATEDQQAFSKIASSEAEFRQLMGDDTEGTLARFVDNKLNVLFWYRSPREPKLIFGAKLGLAKLCRQLGPLVQQVDPAFNDEVCVSLLDDTAKPMLLSHPGFQAASWKHPFVATEIGEVLPHWEVAVYLLNPEKLTKSAQTLKLTLGLLISLLVAAIGIGSWLIVADLNRQLSLARQKTDFVSNVSHELKTPLTSIRMFSELLAEGRVSDAAKQRYYLGIISAETARLSRLINNVLDFARMERGEKKYNFKECELVSLVRESAETYRPHLEAAGFKFECVFPDGPLLVRGDRDALAQIVVNLLSNAEKYSDSKKEVILQVVSQSHPLPYAEVRVSDRGLGVPQGCEEKIFEKFYRAHDSLSSGIQGSGLGLTLARQIAQAHGGDVAYEAREGGGSCFVLRLPIMTPA